MEREEIHINKEILSQLTSTYFVPVDVDYEHYSNEITGSDSEDGGADHTLVIKRKSDGKYFQMYYTDWDMEYNFDSDFPEDLTEVFPKTVTTIIFE